MPNRTPPVRTIIAAIAVAGVATLSGCGLVPSATEACATVVSTVQQAMAQAPDPTEALRNGDLSGVVDAANALADGLGSAADLVPDLTVRAGASGARVLVEQLIPLIEQYAASGQTAQLADIVEQHLTPEAVGNALRVVCPG